MAQKLLTKNNLLEVDVQKTIRENPLTRRLFEIRSSVLNNEEEVDVNNEYLFQFFSKYARGVKSKSKIFNLDSSSTFLQSTNGLCIMYSGGSESVYMDHSFQGDLIKGYNFFPHSVGARREFQCALVGMSLDYATTLIGIEEIETQPREQIKAELYEWSENFVMDWNDSFYPFNIQYPTSQFEKIDLYELLMKRAIPFNPCEDDVPCKLCWKCAECYWIYTAMGKMPPFTVKQAVLDEKRKINADLLLQGKIGDDDIFGTTTLMLKVENRFSYTDWR